MSSLFLDVTQCLLTVMDQAIQGQLYPGVDRLSENSSNWLPNNTVYHPRKAKTSLFIILIHSWIHSSKIIITHVQKLFCWLWPSSEVQWNCFKANSHTPSRSHAVLLPCHAAKGLDCVFPIWFTQCGHVRFTHSMPRPCHAMTMLFWKWLLKATAQSGMGMA
jgi:hypothetical protein